MLWLFHTDEFDAEFNNSLYGISESASTAGFLCDYLQNYTFWFPFWIATHLALSGALGKTQYLWRMIFHAEVCPTSLDFLIVCKG